MAGSVNKVIIVGHLGKDPEVRSLQSGGRVCNLSIATSESWRDKATGERKERTEWHRVTIWNEGLVGVAEQYLRKGAKVYIEGQIETRKWQDQSGQDRYSTEIMLKPYRGELQMLEGCKDDSDVHDAAEPSSIGDDRRTTRRGGSNPQRNYPRAQRPADDRTPSTAAKLADLNDEIPF